MAMPGNERVQHFGKVRFDATPPGALRKHFQRLDKLGQVFLDQCDKEVNPIMEMDVKRSICYARFASDLPSGRTCKPFRPKRALGTFEDLTPGVARPKPGLARVSFIRFG